MHELLKKNIRFEWLEESQKSMNKLKKRLTTALVLIIPQGAEVFEIYYDASKQGLGVVLI